MLKNPHLLKICLSFKATLLKWKPLTKAASVGQVNPFGGETWLLNKILSLPRKTSYLRVSCLSSKMTRSCCTLTLEVGRVYFIGEY